MSDDEIFISYAHLDNQPYYNQLKWVEVFHEKLRIGLSRFLGREPAIWRDLKLGGNDRFSDVIQERVESAGILIPILSPRYLESEWCRREVEAFCRRCPLERVFKVLLLPIPFAEQPAPLAETLGYEFYDVDPASGKVDDIIDLHSDPRFYRKLRDLCWDLKRLLEREPEAPRADLAAGAAAKGPSGGQTIYLAGTTLDLREGREAIRRELQQYGHTVLPAGDPPPIAADLEAIVREDLERSRLSVHLIGERYGLIPEGADDSAAQIQYDLALERGSGLRRLVWIPPGLQPADPYQREFVERLWSEPRLGRGVELLNNKFEDLKTRLHELLNPPPAPSRQNGAAARLYLVCDQPDRPQIRSLRQYLFERGLEVELPLAGDDPVELMRAHKEKLQECDAALIYYGQATERWFDQARRDLIRSVGWERTRPMQAKAIYVGGPPNDEKEDLQSHEFVVIKNFGVFTPESLRPFLERIGMAMEAER
jgi:hypothetical protein